MAVWLTNNLNGHGPWMPMMQDCSKRSATSHIQTIIDHQSTALCDVFFFQQSILPSSKAWNAHRDRNLGIFLITQVITITAEDSLRGPNIPQWNRQENSAYLLYIWRLHHIGLGYHHWNASTFSSHGMPKREMFKTRVVSWFCWRLVAENHWDYLYNLKIQVCFHYKEFCIIQL